MAQWGFVGSVGMWWLSGDLFAQWGCGGSVGICWLSGDVVAQWGFVGSVGMWWLAGDGVAQLAKATQQFRVRFRLPSQSPEGIMSVNYDCE
jgi:hypothetical protein